MPDFLGKLDKVNQIAEFEEQLVCTISTFAAGELQYLVSIGGSHHQKANIHTAVSMSAETAEGIKQTRLAMPLQNGASNMYIIDQQLFYSLINKMIGTNVRDKLLTGFALGRPTDINCCTDLFSRVYTILIHKGATTKDYQKQEA